MMSATSFTVTKGGFTLNLEPADEGGYIVTSPAIPELITEARSLEEAFENAFDAVEALRVSRKPKNVDEFVILLKGSKLVADEGIDSFVQQHQTNDMPVDEFVNLLTTSSLGVTQWQCDKIRNGQWKGFFLDEFKILGQSHFDQCQSYYVAECQRSKRLVVLAIKPPANNAPGDTATHYDVLSMQNTLSR